MGAWYWSWRWSMTEMVSLLLSQTPCWMKRVFCLHSIITTTGKVFRVWTSWTMWLPLVTHPSFLLPLSSHPIISTSPRDQDPFPNFFNPKLSLFVLTPDTHHRSCLVFCDAVSRVFWRVIPLIWKWLVSVIFIKISGGEILAHSGRGWTTPWHSCRHAFPFNSGTRWL